MPGKSEEDEKRDYILSVSYLLENGISCSPIAVVSWLLNISERADVIIGDTRKTLENALRNAPFLSDSEVMLDISMVRYNFPSNHWWWWPEKIER